MLINGFERRYAFVITIDHSIQRTFSIPYNPFVITAYTRKEQSE